MQVSKERKWKHLCLETTANYNPLGGGNGICTIMRGNSNTLVNEKLGNSLDLRLNYKSLRRPVCGEYSVTEQEEWKRELSDKYQNN